MTTSRPTRYELVSRRSVLKASLGAGALAIMPGIACGNDDEQLLAGESAQPEPTTTSSTSTTENNAAAVEDPTTDSTSQPSTTEAEEPSPANGIAVEGEMVISFTYTQAAGGKDERPYVAVWIEDAAGDLVETVALWYEQGRRGDRWLDHLTRWYDLNLAHVATGGIDDTVTISSATRTPGSYAVVWDGTIDGTPAAAGEYHVCIEAVREDGPYSLIRQALSLTGPIAESALPDDGELSAATVRIDA